MSRWIPRISLLLAGCFAAYGAGLSVWLASTATSFFPIADIWSFYSDYFRFVDGNYSLWELFNRHNEHVIFTTRVVLFADNLWLGGTGRTSAIVSYGSAALTGALLAYLAARPRRWEVAGVTVAFLGLVWAQIQLDNLTLPFQVGFPLAHFFALAALIALWRGLDGKWWWYAIAVVCDFGAVFSIGTGIFVGASAIALAMWMRRIDRGFAAFLLGHAAMVALFAWLVLGQATREALVLPKIADGVTYFFAFLGNFALDQTQSTLIGIALAVVSILLFLSLTDRAVRQRQAGPSEVAVLAAFALFVILEAAAAAVGRARYGIDQALSLRYTTCTLLLAASLFATAWRAYPQPFARMATAGLLALFVADANPPALQNGFRARNQEQDALAEEIRRGTLPPGTAEKIFIPADILNRSIWRYRDAGLGPFRRR